MISRLCSSLCAQSPDLERRDWQILTLGFHCSLDAHTCERTTYDASWEVQEMLRLAHDIVPSPFMTYLRQRQKSRVRENVRALCLVSRALPPHVAMTL